MATRILLSYKALDTHFFGDSYEFPFILTLEETYTYWFFWKRKRIIEVSHVISMFQSIRNHKDHLDELIKTGKHIN